MNTQNLLSSFEFVGAVSVTWGRPGHQVHLEIHQFKQQIEKY